VSELSATRIGGPRPAVGWPVPTAAGVAVVAGWSVAVATDDPLPLLVIVAVSATIVAFYRVDLAAAALAAAIAGNLSSVASDVYGLPSPSLALGGLILIGILRRDDRLQFLPPLSMLAAFGAYGLVVLGSAFWAAEPLRTFDTSSQLAREMLLAMLVAIVVRRTRTLSVTLWAMFTTIATLGIVGVLQHVTEDYGSSFLGLAGATQANIVAGTDDWRITGPLGDPNYFAQTLVVGVAIGMVLLAHEHRWPLRLAALVGTAVTTFAILPTYSRGGAVAIVVVVGVFVLLRRPSRLIVGALIGAVLVGALAAPADFRERLLVGTEVTQSAEDTDTAVRGRLSEMLAAAAMFRDQPLSGVGAGNYPAHYEDYAQALQLDDRRAERAAHSLYLEIAAETGILGLGTFGVLLILIGRSLAVHRRRSSGPGFGRRRRGSGEALGLAMVGFLATSVFLHAAHARTLWLLAALILVLPHLSDGSPDQSEPPALATRSQRLMSRPENSWATPWTAATFTRQK
jgi:putative inorganic carbon (hco3(-)) transporter